mmetsp:Transcript_14216/g.29461  ORF Transcript_14216/g.29461 Transcript_14216/m.29461 type:complete len:102 (+) Transcript_14216:880-1185(+)
MAVVAWWWHPPLLLEGTGIMRKKHLVRTSQCRAIAWPQQVPLPLQRLGSYPCGSIILFMGWIQFRCGSMWGGKEAPPPWSICLRREKSEENETDGVLRRLV